MHGKSLVGLIIAGAMALKPLIDIVATSPWTLAQEVQTASIVNHPAENVTNALSIEEDLDRQLEQRIDTFYNIVQIMADEVYQGMRVWSHLECHAWYFWICVVPNMTVSVIGPE